MRKKIKLIPFMTSLAIIGIVAALILKWCQASMGA